MGDNIQCSEECKALQRKWQVEVDQFKLTYPYYCTACNGLGGHSWYDDSTGLTEVEICPVCIGAEDTVPICNLCGQIMSEDIDTDEQWGMSINLIGYSKLCTCPIALTYQNSQSAFVGSLIYMMTI